MRHIPKSPPNEEPADEEAVNEEMEPVSSEEDEKETDFPMENGHAADLWSFENSSIINAISDYDSEEVELIWR